MNLKELTDFHNEVKKLKAESQEMFSQAKAASDFKAAAETLQVRERAIMLDMEMNELIAKMMNPMITPSEPQQPMDFEAMMQPQPITTKKTKTILD